MQLALGLIETKGLVGAIEAADAMAKAADVTIISKEKITAALVTIKITGEVAAVRSALDAGAAAAQRVGQLVSVHIIPRPDDQLDDILYDNSVKAGSDNSGKDSSGNPGEDDEDPEDSGVDSEEGGEIEILDIKNINLAELELMNVHRLRSLARGLAQFPIRGREISKANKQVLLDYFRKLK
ncbi:MAG: BMC domain-containing protein [Syntrophomonadaceae bacterium]